jgi:hypothetical protein
MNAYCEDCNEAWVAPCTQYHGVMPFTQQQPFISPWTITYNNESTTETYCGHVTQKHT